MHPSQISAGPAAQTRATGPETSNSPNPNGEAFLRVLESTQKPTSNQHESRATLVERSRSSEQGDIAETSPQEQAGQNEPVATDGATLSNDVESLQNEEAVGMSLVGGAGQSKAVEAQSALTLPGAKAASTKHGAIAGGSGDSAGQQAAANQTLPLAKSNSADDTAAPSDPKRNTTSTTKPPVEMPNSPATRSDSTAQPVANGAAASKASTPGTMNHLVGTPGKTASPPGGGAQKVAGDGMACKNSPSQKAEPSLAVTPKSVSIATQGAQASTSPTGPPTVQAASSSQTYREGTSPTSRQTMDITQTAFSPHSATINAGQTGHHLPANRSSWGTVSNEGLATPAGQLDPLMGDKAFADSDLPPQLGTGAASAKAQVIGLPAATPAMAQNAAAQMAAAMQAQSNSALRDQPTEIALDPPELGRVRMVFSLVEGALTLSITADRPETLDLMRRHMDLLSQEFSRAGLGGTAFSFSGGEENPNLPQSSHQTVATDDPSTVTDPTSSIQQQTRQHNGALDLRL